MTNPESRVKSEMFLFYQRSLHWLDLTPEPERLSVLRTIWSYYLPRPLKHLDNVFKSTAFLFVSLPEVKGAVSFASAQSGQMLCYQTKCVYYLTVAPVTLQLFEIFCWVSWLFI